MALPCGEIKNKDEIRIRWVLGVLHDKYKMENGNQYFPINFCINKSFSQLIGGHSTLT